MTLEKRDELIADMLEYFNAKPITLSNNKDKVLCVYINTTKWVLVDLITTDSNDLTDDEATEISKKWLLEII